MTDSVAYEVSPLESDDLTVRIANLEKTLYELRAKLEAERSEGPPTALDLDTSASEIQNQLAQLDAQVRPAKALAKQRKSEIDEWKQWYHTLPDDEKEEGLPKLNSEIQWRAAELADLTPKISELLAQQATAQGELDMVEQQRMALEAGVYDRPIEEDPRLTSLESQLAAARGDSSRSSNIG